MKFLPAFLACTLSCQLAVAQKPSYEAFGATGKYTVANSSLPDKVGNEKRVVFFGNSITELWADNYPAYFKANGYIGRGIGGQTSYQYLIRYRQDVIDLKPDLVVIGCGTNDIAENAGPYSEDRTMGNLQTMVELAEANGIRPVLTSCLPAESMFWNKSVSDAMGKIRSLNKRIEAYARAKGLDYVDYFSALLSADGKGMNPEYTTDGVHPNAAGYRVMQRVITPYLDK